MARVAPEVLKLRDTDWASATLKLLTKPQLAELRRCGDLPQHNCGAATVRLHNTLSAHDLVDIRPDPANYYMDHAFITKLGKAVLAEWRKEHGA